MIFKKSFVLLFFLSVLLSVGCSDKSKKIDKDGYSEDVAKTISVATSGVISSTDQIVVRFVNDVIPDNLVNTNVIEPVLSFSPEIEGTLRWKDKKTLIFTPSVSLKLNQIYTAKLDLQKLFPNDNKLKVKEFKFSFQVAPREVVYIKGDFSPESYENPKKVIFTGEVLLTEPFDVKQLKNAVTVKLDNEKIKPTFSFREDFKQFTFTVKNIVRNTKHTILVKIDKDKLNVSKDIKKVFEIFPAGKLKVIKVRKGSKGKSLYFQVFFSDNLDKGQELQGLISVEPALKLTLKKSGKRIVVKGDFKHGSSYKLTVHKGIRSKFGDRLENDYTETFRFLDLKPNIKFASSGVFLPNSNNRKLQFYTTNVKQVYLTVKKVFESNIGIFLQDEMLENSKSRSYGFYSVNSVGVTVIKNKKLIIGEKKNVEILNELDLNKLLEKDAKGMYLFQLSFKFEDMLYSHPNPSRYDDYYNDPRSKGYIYDHGKVFKPVLLSSIGMVLKKAGNSYKVFITDIDTAKPLKGIKVVLKSFQNQVISSKTSNSNGVAEFENVKDKVYLVEGIRDYEKSIVFVNKMQMNYSSFDTEGVKVNEKGIKAFIYTERGVYRPGDKVNFSIILRNSSNSFPNNHPIEVKISNPKRQVVFEKVLANGKDGFYSFPFKTDEKDLTGNWQLSVKAGDKYFYHILKVETVVPYKLKINLETQKKVITAKNRQVKLKVDTKYLFGSPASNLKFEIMEKLNLFEKKPKLFRDYVFTNKSIDFKESVRQIFSGSLNKEGQAFVKWTIPNIKSAPSSLILTVEATVFEKGGRPNKKKLVLPVEPYDYYVGIEKPKTDYGYVKSGETLTLNTVVVNQKGEPVSGKPVSYKLYKNNLYWWWEYRNSYSRKLKFKSDVDTEVVKEGDFISTSNTYPLKLQIEDEGEYFLEVQTGDGHSSGIFFSAGGFGSSLNAKEASVVRLKTDKKEYEPGDTAQIMFKAPKDSTVLVSVEKGFDILKFFTVKPSKNGTANVNIDITKEMVPNAYVVISIIQGRKGLKNDRPLRMFGVVPLNVVLKNSKQQIEIDMPDKVKSGEDFSVKIRTTDKKQTRFTVAVVDEGLLALTNFKTPNPHKFFYAKERLSVITSDMFSYVIGVNREDIFNLFSIGGGVALSPEQNEKGGSRRRFTPVCLFKGPIETDKNGNATVKFKMPDYIGAVRVMVVSANKNRYGSAEKSVKVIKDLMALPVMPRVLHPNDKFLLPVTVFTMNDNIAGVKVKVDADDNLIVKDNVKVLNFDKSGQQDVFFNVSVKSFVGKAKLTVNVTSKNHSFSKTFFLSVLPVAKRMYKQSVQTIKKGEEITVSIPCIGMEGSNKAFVTIMKTPNLNIDSRVSRLIHYPYGCVEQTTSAAFPLLYLNKVVNLTDEEKDKSDKIINKAVSKLQTFVVPSGGLSYWPGGSRVSLWGTNYAMHFLIEAKKLGYYVPDNLFNSLIKFQSSMALTIPKNLTIATYRVYLLSLIGKPSKGGMNLLKESYLREMTNVQKWLLGTAYYLSGDESSAYKILQGVSANVESSKYYYQTFGSELRNKAVILDMATTLKREKIATKLLLEISDVLSSNQWLSTQTTAYSLIAVSKYFANEANKNSVLKGEVLFPDGTKKQFETDKVSVKFEIKDNFSKPLKVRLLNNSTVKKAFVNISWSGIPENVFVNSTSNNIKLSVDFYNESGAKINVDNLKSSVTFYAVYKVKTTNYATINNVSLEQMLPSGWEIENTRLSGERLPQFILNMDYGANYADYTDIRDDRIVWFFTLGYRNEKVFAVKLNAVTKGEFSLPPTFCEAMYDKEKYNAVLSGKQVSVK